MRLHQGSLPILYQTLISFWPYGSARIPGPVPCPLPRPRELARPLIGVNPPPRPRRSGYALEYGRTPPLSPRPGAHGQLSAENRKGMSEALSGCLSCKGGSTAASLIPASSATSPMPRRMPPHHPDIASEAKSEIASPWRGNLPVAWGLQRNFVPHNVRIKESQPTLA